MFDGAAASDPMPFGTAIGLGLLLLAAGVTLLVVALRSRGGTLPRNWIVGIRTTQTLADDEAWHRAHLAAASPLLLA
ncbi:MAG: SdpI family protein, partial [Acidimicrobiia bacterium]|nr:SdpI family protein [Acidimicrobiia bacterium]